jgi:hypothetical protein
VPQSLPTDIAREETVTLFEYKIPADTPPDKCALLRSLISQWQRVSETHAVLRKPLMRSLTTWGMTKLDAELGSGRLPSFLLDGFRVTTPDILFGLLIDEVLASPRRATKPGRRFARKVRARTPNELRGLQIANRAEAAAKRREAVRAPEQAGE